MLHNKNKQSYSLPSGEKRVGSRKQKSGPIAVRAIDIFTVQSVLQENGCSYSY